MLYERDYMNRPSPPGTGNSTTRTLLQNPLPLLLVLITAAYLLEYILLRWFSQAALNTFIDYAALSQKSLLHGRLWTLLTYALLHQAPSTLHLHFLLNTAALYYISRQLLPLIGSARYLVLFGISTLAGALAWLAANSLHPNQHLLGASAAIFGLLTLLIRLSPDKPVPFRLLFIIPVAIRLRHILTGLIAIEVIGMFLFEIPRLAAPLSIAHSAHLGGVIGAILFHKLLFNSRIFSAESPQVIPPDWLQKTRRTPPIRSTTDLSTRDTLAREADRILDKIHTQGINSLSNEEKQTLEQHRSRLNPRQ